MNDKLRDEIQMNAFIAWDNEGKKGTVEMATGLGKTFVALHALHSMPKNDSLVHLHLAETGLREAEFKKAIEIYDKIYDCNTLQEYNIRFACYQSAHRWINVKFGLVIADI